MFGSLIVQGRRVSGNPRHFNLEEKTLSYRILMGTLCAAGMVGLTSLAQASPITLNFETEDDFVTPLINGQIIDAAFDANDLEFGNLVTISSTNIGSDGHLGVTVFDSDASDQLPNTQDPDLLVGLGNILILQNDDSPNTANDTPEGLRYTFPNDEASINDRGSIRFDFVGTVLPESIDLVDVNGGVNMVVTLTDAFGLTRTYNVPQKWTTDVTKAPQGYQTLFLTTLNPQPSEANAIGGDATAIEDPGFLINQVVTMDVAIGGSSPSGGIDNLVFTQTDLIPEPASFAMLGVGGLLMIRRK